MSFLQYQELVDDVKAVTVQDKGEADQDEQQIIRSSVVSVILIDPEYYRCKEVDDEQRHFDDDKAPEDYYVPAFGLTVYVPDDEVDDADADDKVIQVQEGVGYHQDPIVQGTCHTVACESIYIGNTVEDGHDEQRRDDAALFLTRRKVPSP